MRSHIFLAALVFFFAAALTPDARADDKNPPHCSSDHTTFVPLPAFPTEKSSKTRPLGPTEDSEAREGSAAAQTTEIREPSAPAYLRMHPSGDYAIVSHQEGPAYIVDMRDKANPKLLPTPLRREANAVEPSWELVSSPYSKGGMEYYRFEDLLKLGKKATPVFRDFRHNEFYQSHAEFPDSRKEALHFRTVLYTTLLAREYNFEERPGTKSKVKKGTAAYLCENLEENLFEPNLSKDGRYLSALSVPNEIDYLALSSGSSASGQKDSSMKVYEIRADGTCAVARDLKVGTGKANFSYAPPGKKGFLGFSSNASIQGADGSTRNEQVAFVVDLDGPQDARPRMISLPWLDKAPESTSFAKDGKAAYGTIRDGVPGLVLVDLAKLPPLPAVGRSYIDCFPAKPEAPATASPTGDDAKRSQSGG